MSAPRDCRDTELLDDPFERIDDCRHRTVADDMESGGDASLGAGEQMLGDDVGVEIPVTGAPGGIVVGRAQRRRVRAECAVDKEISGKPLGSGGRNEGPGLSGTGHCLTPVTHHLDVIIAGAQLIPVFSAADLRAGALVDGHDSGRGGRVQRGPAGEFPLPGGEQAARFGANEVVGLSRQRPLRVETRYRR